MEVFPSYSIHNCQEYKQTLKNMYLMNRSEARRCSLQLDPNIRHMLEYNSLRRSIAT